MKTIIRTSIFSFLAFASIFSVITPVLGGEKEILQFTEKIWPNLESFFKKEGVILLEGETKEDFMTAAYSLAVLRGRMQFGLWDDNLLNELRFSSGFLCALPWWPKEQNVKKKLEMVRRQITLNAYNRAIVQLSIENRFYEYKPQQIWHYIKYPKTLPDIPSLINLDVAIRNVHKDCR